MTSLRVWPISGQTRSRPTLANALAAFIVKLRKLQSEYLEAGTGGKVIKTSLTHEDERRLQSAISAAKP